MTTSSPHNPQIRGTLAIIGVGLIGGSIARAVRKRFPDAQVLGIGRSETRLRAAVEADVLTQFSTSIEAVAAADIIVGCTPVNRLADDLAAAAKVAPDMALLTDGGSVKAPLCKALQAEPRFVGAHPLAGSARTGWEAADADLFVDKLCVVTPTSDTSETLKLRTEQFWQAIGMRTIAMSPADHDAAVAQTSHLPHIGSAAVARLLEDANRPLAAAGFRDTTRVAAGDPAMWTAIVEANAEAISGQLRRLIDDLNTLQAKVDAGDLQAIHQWFETAAEIRRATVFE